MLKRWEAEADLTFDIRDSTDRGRSLREVRHAAVLERRDDRTT